MTLQEAADAVRATFTAANQAGVSSARITLSPASLGGIQISLTQTSGGLVAHVAADHPDAVRTLEQNAAELRRSLEQNGVSLLQLDIGSSGDQAAGYSPDAGSSQTRRVARLGDETDGAGDIGTDGGNATDTTTMTIQLTSGALVDVMA